MSTKYQDGVNNLEDAISGFFNPNSKVIDITNNDTKLEAGAVGITPLTQQAVTENTTIGQVVVTQYAVISNYATFNDKYDYVNGLAVLYDESGDSFTVFYGNETKIENRPTIGKAEYTGHAEGYVKYPTAADPPLSEEDVRLTDGKSLVAVDFGKNSVDVTLNSFSPQSPGGGAVTGKDYEISVTGMTINDDGFSGGTSQVLLQGDVVDFGADKNTVAIGQFYGYDNANKIPDEVAGAISVVGNGNTVEAGFAAD